MSGVLLWLMNMGPTLQRARWNINGAIVNADHFTRSRRVVGRAKLYILTYTCLYLEWDMCSLPFSS